MNGGISDNVSRVTEAFCFRTSDRNLLGKVMLKSNNKTLMVAISVIASIVVGIWIFSLNVSRTPSRSSITKENLHKLRQLCISFKKKFGRPPNQATWTNELICKLVIGDNEVLETDARDAMQLLTDAWGNKIVYNQRNTNFTLYSIGPNSLDEQGFGDDIVIEE